MIFINTLNTKDKVTSLATLIEEIKYANILNEADKKLKIKKLKSTCFDIDTFINEAIEYSKTIYLKEVKIYLLIEHGKRLKEIQKSFEIELENLGSKRDFQNEYELRAAFDFELKPINKIDYIENAHIIEKRIRTELENSIVIGVKNKYENVFKNDKAYKLFLEMHKKYIGEEKDLANYSFLYYAMLKDKLIICRGVEFIRFLSKEFDVTIDKIDNRQSGTNYKYTLYNAIKD
jgi:hypothetical protein